MKPILFVAGIFVSAILKGQTERFVSVRFSWTAEACLAPHSRLAAQDLGTPQSAAGMTLYLTMPEYRKEWKLEADEKGCVLIPALQGSWQVFAPEKKRHYGSMAEKDSACLIWKQKPNALFFLNPPIPDTLIVTFHRTCPPCRIPLPDVK